MNWTKHSEVMTANISAIITLLLALLAGMNVEPTPDPPVTETWQTYEATAYTAKCRGCIGITKSGLDVRHTIFDEDGRNIIATDPAVIPLGSVVEVRLADGSTFEATAQDIGGDIKGRRIDVLHETYDGAIEFGRQDVDVRLLSSP
ncbi:3D domain-containing protein [Paenibacillus abyssi]|uniref:3D domain-containing protein n=1 Tax=Paenibacillus abyssi TaxID=1340531 RepID=UPI00166C4370|nr:3D domain-containing protein [Paenibacillus abyssi]